MIHIQKQRWEEIIDKDLYLLTTDGGSVQLEIYDDPDLFPDLSGSNRAYIFRLWVEEGQRNKGIASALLNTAEEIVRRNGIDAVYLNHYKKAPRWIYDWYVRRGYKEVDCSNEERLMKLTFNNMIGQSKIKDAENTIGAMKEAGYNIKLSDPIGHLVHEPTMSRI